VASQEEIQQQQDLLATHRRTLAHLIRQAAAYGGETYAPVSAANGMHEARQNIVRIKGVLHGWGVAVEEHPDDENPIPHVLARNLPEDVREWIARCYAFVIDRDGERHTHIHARKFIEPTKVSGEWWQKHTALDQQARLIELDLQDLVLPKVAVIDPQLADILRQIGDRLEELRFALLNVESDRDLQAEYNQVSARIDELLASDFSEGTYSRLSCPICSEKFTRRQIFYDHFQHEHPRPPLGARVLIDAFEHYANVGRIGGPLRALFREVERRKVELDLL
jgi:hypothetical protein